MNPGRGARTLGAVAAWAARRPRLVLGVAALVLLGAVLALSRVQLSASFQDLLGESSPSAAALARISRDYRALDELLVIAEAPPGAHDAGILAAYAQRLERAIAADPDAQRMTARVRWRQDPEETAFFREIVLPAGAHYLSDTALGEFIHRLGEQEMRTQIARNEALAAAPGPAAAAIGKAILRDPLRLTELVEGAAGIAADMQPGGDVELRASPPGGPALLIRVAGVRPTDDLAFSAAFTDRIAALARESESQTGGVRATIGGGYAIAAASSRGIRRDSIVSTLSAAAMLVVLFTLLYRGPGAPLMIGLSAGAGMVAGFGAHALAAPTLTPLTAVIAAILAGLGVDYGIHLLSHFDAARAAGHSAESAARAAVEHVGPPIVAGCLTSAIGFASLAASRLAMLGDFSLLGALGLFGCLVAAFTLLPAMLAISGRGRSFGGRAAAETTRAGGVSPRIAMPTASDPCKGATRMSRAGSTNRSTWLAHRPATWLEHRPRSAIVAAITTLAIIATLATLRGWTPALETDLTVMHPRPNPALEHTDRAGRLFTSAAETLALEVRADSPAAMMAAAHDAARALASPSARRAGVTGVEGVNLLLPDPRRAAEVQRRFAGIDPAEVIARFDRAVASSIFDPAAFAAYRDALRDLVTPGPAPGAADLLRYPSIAERLFPEPERRAGSPRNTVLAVRFDRPLTRRRDRDAAIAAVRAPLEGIPGVTLTGMNVLAHDLEAATRQDVPRSLLLSAALIVASLFAFLRRPADVAVALIPLVFGGIFTLALIAAAGLPINAVNGVALPLLVGISVDAGAILVVAARRSSGQRGERASQFTPTLHALLAASTTTIAGFGALLLTSTPAIRSLGLVAAVGVAAGLMGSVLVATPLLLLRSERERGA